MICNYEKWNDFSSASFPVMTFRFFLPRNGTTGVLDLLFAGGSHRPKNLNNPKEKNHLLILSFIHIFVHTLLSAPEAVTPDRQSAT